MVLGEDLENYVKIAQLLIVNGATVDDRSRKISWLIASKYPFIERVKNLTWLLTLSNKKASDFKYLPDDVFHRICVESREPLKKSLFNCIENEMTEEERIIYMKTDYADRQDDSNFLHYTFQL